MNFIHVPDNVKQITCMKLSPQKVATGKPRYLLVAEQHKASASCFISVYDLNEAVYVAQKMHNITELTEGRGNAIVNGTSVNLHSNNTVAATVNTSQAAAGAT